MTPFLAVISAVLLGPPADPVTSVDVLPAAERTEIVIALNYCKFFHFFPFTC